MRRYLVYEEQRASFLAEIRLLNGLFVCVLTEPPGTRDKLLPERGSVLFKSLLLLRGTLWVPIARRIALSAFRFV